jgi:hypothetical protein
MRIGSLRTGIVAALRKSNARSKSLHAPGSHGGMEPPRAEVPITPANTVYGCAVRALGLTRRHRSWRHDSTTSFLVS